MKKILVAGAAALLLSPVAGFAVGQRAQTPVALAPTAPQEAIVQATPARKSTISIYAPARPKGVVLFSHGAGAGSTRYPNLYARLNAAGYVVLAPLHVDSRQHPDVAKYNLMSAFPERIADMGAAAKLAAERFPGLPVAAVGHSYGALLAQMQGGALKNLIDARTPSVKAVVSFSSPGRLANFIPAGAFETLAVPSLMVTGTEDLVPGLVTDWRDHLRSYEEAPAGRSYALTIEGGDHLIPSGRNPAHFARAADATINFLDAYLLNDRRALRRLTGAGLKRR